MQNTLHELRLLLRELHLVEAVAAERHLRALRALLGRRPRGRRGRDRGLRERYSRLVGREAWDPDVVVAFCGRGHELWSAGGSGPGATIGCRKRER